MNKVRILFILSTLIMLFLLMGTIAQAKAPTTKEINQALDLALEHTYPTVGKVTKINKRKGIVYVSEVGGNVFSFKEDREFVTSFYHKGDIIVLIMYDNGTTTEEDDIILRSINYGKEIL